MITRRNSAAFAGRVRESVSPQMERLLGAESRGALKTKQSARVPWLCWCIIIASLLAG
jgi:hypothetical protein